MRGERKKECVRVRERLRERESVARKTEMEVKIERN